MLTDKIILSNGIEEEDLFGREGDFCAWWILLDFVSGTLRVTIQKIQRHVPDTLRVTIQNIHVVVSGTNKKKLTDFQN